MTHNTLVWFDIFLATAVVYGAIKFFNWFSPKDGLAKLQVSIYVVNYMERHRHWYVPSILSLGAIITSVALYYNLLATGIAFYISVLLLVVLQYRLWWKLRYRQAFSGSR